jgi:hypothetical protein
LGVSSRHAALLQESVPKIPSYKSINQIIHIIKARNLSESEGTTD